jgi:hypothetical protein
MDLNLTTPLLSGRWMSAAPMWWNVFNGQTPGDTIFSNPADAFYLVKSSMTITAFISAYNMINGVHYFFGHGLSDLVSQMCSIGS